MISHLQSWLISLNLFPNVWSEKSEILIRYHKAELHLITDFYTEADGTDVN
jgi:hypothetical protein